MSCVPFFVHLCNKLEYQISFQFYLDIRYDRGTYTKCTWLTGDMKVYYCEIIGL